MNYCEWSKKSYEHFFNADNNNQEVILYIDDNLLDQLSESKNGKEDFLAIFNPKLILSSCYPIPNNRLSIRDQTSQRDEFKSLEAILQYLIENPNAKFSINNKQLSSSDPLSYFPFILLVIYAYGTKDGVFNSTSEKEMVGRDIEVRKNTYRLYTLLAEKLKNKYFLNVYNIYNVLNGPHRYAGLFKYHSLFNTSDLLTIKKIIYRNEIDRPIYNDVLLYHYFENIPKINTDTIGPAKLLINKIIEGTLVVDKRETVSTNQIAIRNEIVLYPLLQLNNNVIEKQLLKPKLNTEQPIPRTIILKIGNDQKEVQYHQEGGWFKSFDLNDETITSNSFDVINNANKVGTFYQQLGSIFTEFPPDTNYYIGIKDPKLGAGKTIFIGTQALKNNLIKEDKKNEWKVVDDYLVCDNLKEELFCNGKKFLFIPNTSSAEQLLEVFGGFRIKNTGHDKIYPYFLLPKLNFNFPENSRLLIKYKISDENEGMEKEIKTDGPGIFNNTIEKYGKYGYDLNKFYEEISGNGRPIKFEIELTDIKNETCKSISLSAISEFRQKAINANNFQINQIIKINNGFEKSTLEELNEICKNDYLSRILATSITNEVVLNNKSFEEIIKQAKFHKRIFLKESEDSIDIIEVIKNLRALGYIKVKQATDKNSDYFYEDKELALIQIKGVPQPFNETGFNFFLSGLRSYEFMKALFVEIAGFIRDSEIMLSIKTKSEGKLYDLLPPEIYFIFKNKDVLIKFLQTKINYLDEQIEIAKYIKIVPLLSESLEKLKHIDMINIESYLLQQTLSECEPDLTGRLEILVEGGPDKYTLVKRNNTDTVFIGKGPNKGNYKQINTNLGYIIAYSDNKLPYIFSKHIGNKDGLLPILINVNVKLPQDIYSKLVYINGGLPSVCSLEFNLTTRFHNSPKTFDNINSKFLDEKVKFFYEFNLDLNQRSILEEILSTKIIYIQNANVN